MNTIVSDRKILLVEGCATLASLAGLYLRRRFPDLEIVEAHSCGEARSALRNHNFSALIVDGSLPDGDGLDLVADVSRLPSTGRVILTTPSPSVGDAVETNFFWLNKPFRLEDLADFVDGLLKSLERKR